MYAQTSKSEQNSTLRNDTQEIWPLCIVCPPKDEPYKGIRYLRKEDKSMNRRYTAMQPFSCFEIGCYRALTCRCIRFGSIPTSKLLNQFPTIPRQNSKRSIPGWVCQKAFVERGSETKILSRIRVRRFGITQPRISQTSIAFPCKLSAR